jgi:putative endonuclease
MGAHHFYVYILANKIGGTLYIGVTNDLIRRVAEHRQKSMEGFTKKNTKLIGWFISSNSMMPKTRSDARSV